MESLRVIPARDAGVAVERIFEAALLELPNPLVHANFSAQCDRAQRRSLLSRNAPRRVQAPPVELVRYPPGTLVEGDRSYLVLAGDALVSEQIAPWFTDLPFDVARLRDYGMRAEHVAAPCLLASRFGENTWGHWVFEMLAKVAVAERLWPGRFSYVVPGWITEPEATRGYAHAVLESLAAYGIVPERLIRLGSYRAYRFSQLHDVADLWSDGPHPGALAALRAVGVPHGKSPRRIASLRRGQGARAVFNASAIKDFLHGEGFALCALEQMSFLDQVRLFRQAEIVVAGLGSDCTGMLFAREGTGIVTLAPAQWSDGYFIRLFQRLGVRHADVRGPSTLLDDGDPSCASHIADPGAIAAALAALQRDPTDTMMVDGEAMPRRSGENFLSLDFGAGGNAARYCRSGWAAAEAGHTWSVGPCSTLVLPRDLLPEGAFWIEIEGMGHVHPPHLPTRPLTVVVDGQDAGSFDVIGDVRLFFLAPGSLALGSLAPGGSGEMIIEFRHPLCPSPRMLGTGDDDRPLGFGFRRLEASGPFLKKRTRKLLSI